MIDKQKRFIVHKLREISRNFEELAEAILDENSTSVSESYDPNYGDGKVCVCGHTYHRHFDSYGNMEPVGCKYCECDKYSE